MGDHIKVFLLGAENPDSARGLYLDGVILDEYAQVDPRIWGEVIRPALADRNGWAIFIGTPQGENHFWDVLNVAKENKTGSWFFAILKASQTNVLPVEELSELKATMTEDQYAQELECSFTAALSGAYYGKEMTALEAKGFIGKIPHDPNLLVDTFWDLGINDTTCIWFMQQYRHEKRIIDYFEMAGEGLPYYAGKLRADHRADYNYREHNWPHDGGSKDLSTGKERSVVGEGLGIKPIIVQPRLSPADGIDAVRRLLPTCQFDLAKCDRGISALKNYSKRWDGKNKIWLDSPLHNWASNGADAFRNLAMAIRPGVDRSQSSNLPRTSGHAYDIFKA
jgi:phage terminase large subunit